MMVNEDERMGSRRWVEWRDDEDALTLKYLKQKSNVFSHETL